MFSQNNVPQIKLKRLIVFSIASFFVLMYFTYAPMVNRNFYDIKVLFKPVKYDKFNPWWYDRKAEEAFFKNKNGHTLHGAYLPSAKTNHVILVHHGQYGNISYHLPMCGFLLQPDDALFIYDYAGFGKSEGSPTIEGMADDATAAYDCLVEKFHIDPKKIVHYGSSLGSGPAALVAADKPCAGLILFSPYTSIKAAARDIYPFMYIYPDFLMTDYDFDTLTNVRRFHKPILIVHGAADASIKITNGDRIYNAANEPKTYMRMAGQGHGLYLTDEMKAELLRFIRNLRTN